MPRRPNRFARYLGVAFLLLLPLPVPAATFYVATDGDDTAGDGSQANPWATITQGLDTVPGGSLILVQPGTYNGRVRLRGTFAEPVVVRSLVPYQARLRHDATVVTCFEGVGIELEGFDIAHSGPGSGGLVIQVQDLIGNPGGIEYVSRIVFRNNIIHDSYNNDLLKINNGAHDVLVEGNLFYNQSGSDEHIDVNSVVDVTIQDNVFFNDFAGSGRTNDNSTSSYIVVKDSDGADNDILGSQRVSIRRNVFFHWEGSDGSNYILFGEDGMMFHEAVECLVENNLLLGDSSNQMRAPFGVKGCKDILFRNNTIVGDLPSKAYGMRLNTEGDNLPNENIRFRNNLWSDPTGTMGAETSASQNDFSDTPSGETLDFELDNNLYWNGFEPIPEDSGELVNYTDDPDRVLGDPVLPALGGLILPRWNAGTDLFADGSATIREVFVRIIEQFGTPGEESAARDSADPGNAPVEDILGNPRPVGADPDIGAVEVRDSIPSSVSGWVLF